MTEEEEKFMRWAYENDTSTDLKDTKFKQPVSNPVDFKPHETPKRDCLIGIVITSMIILGYMTVIME